MHAIPFRFLPALTAWGLSCLISSPAHGQGATLQLPVFSVFNIRTAVSVPDGGTLNLGGARGGQFGTTRRGVPGLSQLPLAGRGLGVRAIGSQSFLSQSQVHVQIIDLKEQEAAILAEAQRRRDASQERDPNGSEATQRRADFLSRHIGKSKKR